MNQLISLLTNFGASCAEQSKFGIPTWYKYLGGQARPNGECQLLGNFKIDKIQQVTGIGLAVLEILLFVAGIVTIAYIIYGGFLYVLSQGDAEKTRTAKNSVLNAVIGLVIAIIATVVVRFLGSKLIVS